MRILEAVYFAQSHDISPKHETLSIATSTSNQRLNYMSCAFSTHDGALWRVLVDSIRRAPWATVRDACQHITATGQGSTVPPESSRSASSSATRTAWLHRRHGHRQGTFNNRNHDARLSSGFPKPLLVAFYSVVHSIHILRALLLEISCTVID